MEKRDWLVYPWQVDGKIAEWQERFPDLVRVETLEQYTRHKVHAITVSGRIDDESLPGHLFYVPHAHEPAGTAACMNFINQLLTGHHLDGAPSTLARRDVLDACVLTFMPDANPYGRSRCPEPFWEGRRYSNREFINMVFGIGDVYSDEALKPRWERYKRVKAFSVEKEVPARIGLVYEQVGEYDYVEPGRYDERATLVRLVRKLLANRPYNRVLSLHQTEFEGHERENCMVMLPDIVDEMPGRELEQVRQWAESIVSAWERAGGVPVPLADPASAGYPRETRSIHRRQWGSLRDELQRQSLRLVVEIQNNNPRTPAEEQLLLADVAIWASVELIANSD